MVQLRPKLDENLPSEAMTRAQARGHDVATVLQQQGVIVLRPPLQSITTILAILDTALAYAESHSPSGQFWIVDPGRVRVRE